MASYPRTATTIEKELERLAVVHPAPLCRRFPLANPTHKGKKAHALRIAGGGPVAFRPKVVVVSGVHAREWAPPDAVLEFVTELLTAYAASADIVDAPFVHQRFAGTPAKVDVPFGEYRISAARVKKIVESLELIVAPMVNPDGRDFSLTSVRGWRKNLRPHPAGGASIGVDLNRNFDIGWDYGVYYDAAAKTRIETKHFSVSSTASSEVFRGDPAAGAASEPETQNVRALVQNDDADYYLDVHAYEGSIMWPWGLENNQTQFPGDSFREKTWDLNRDGPDEATASFDDYLEWIPTDLLAKHEDLAKKMAAEVTAAHGGAPVPAYVPKQSVALYPTTGASDDWSFSRQFPPHEGRNKFAFTIEAGDAADGRYHPAATQFRKVRRDIFAALVAFLEGIAAAAATGPPAAPAPPAKIPTRELFRDTWSAGWTHIACFDLPGSGPHAVFYKSGAGGVSWDKIRASGKGSDQIGSDSWQKGWTSVVPFNLGGKPHLLTYMAKGGEMDIDEIAAGGTGSTTIHTEQWTDGWTSIFPFEVGGAPHFLSYKAATGRVSIDELSATGKTFTTKLADTWTTGWSLFAPFAVGGRQFYLAYREGDGTAVIDEITGGGTGVTTHYRDTWTKGWTAIVPFVHGGTVLYLAYKAGSGDMVVDKIRPAFDGVDTVVKDKWTTGWTTFAPFTRRGRPHYIAYKIASPNTGIVEEIKAASLL